MHKTLTLSLFISTILVTNVLAETGTWSCGDNCTATLDENGLMHISGSGSMTNWATYTDVPWYQDRSLIKNLIIDKGITNVGSWAFSQTSNLLQTTLPSGIINIDKGAFWNSGIKHIDLPDTLKIIGDEVFNWSGLTQIDFPESLTNIGDSFRGASLVDIIIPENVNKIKSATFSNNYNVRTLTIGENTLLEDIFTYPGGYVIADLDNIKIYCTGDIEKCKNNAGSLSGKVLQATKKQINGKTYIYDKQGNLVSVSGTRTNKRIYTLEEAQARLKEIGKDHVTFRIRYK